MSRYMISFNHSFSNPELAFMELHRFLSKSEDTCKGLEVLCLYPYQLRQFKKRHMYNVYLHFFPPFDFISQFQFRLSLNNEKPNDDWITLQISITSNSYIFSSPCATTLFG